MQAAPRLPAWGWLAVAGGSLLQLWLALRLPVTLLADTRHDDAWYFWRARDLAAGDWLGPYDQLTLMKGPGYPLFAALSYRLGLPVTLSQALLYLAGVALLAHAVLQLGRSAGLAVALFLLLLLHPAIPPVRLIRDDIYAAQALILVACAVHLLLLPPGARGRLGWAIGGGLAFAWLWVTREEGAWILPGLALLAGAALWRERGRWRGLAVAAATAALALAALAGANRLAYGSFAIVDLKDPAFNRALAALERVRVGERVAHVPVPARVREAIYAESPAFAALRPWFDGLGGSYLHSSCTTYPATCGDYAGGWFHWALRDAVAWAGHYRTPQDAAAAYRQIAGEVEAACAAGRLDCGFVPVAAVPPLPAAQWRELPARLGALARLLLSQQPLAPPRASRGKPGDLQAMMAAAGGPPRTAGPDDPAGTPKVGPAGQPARRVLKALDGLYRLLMPALALAAALAGLFWLGQVARGIRRPDGIAWLAAALWLLVLARGAVLVLIDLAAFPAVNEKYLSAAYPLLGAALLLTAALPFRRGLR
ncbi:MAG: hypothetical protein U1E53_22640 [Dongiaceae bacterium]